MSLKASTLSLPQQICPGFLKICPSFPKIYPCVLKMCPGFRKMSPVFVLNNMNNIDIIFQRLQPFHYCSRGRRQLSSSIKSIIPLLCNLFRTKQIQSFICILKEWSRYSLVMSHEAQKLHVDLIVYPRCFYISF